MEHKLTASAISTFLRSPKLEVARFWSKVEIRGKKNCWIWRGTKTGQMGYGNFKQDNKSGPTSAHRYSYKFFFGTIPKGKFVLHKCDEPRCVNPAHLECGTPKQNIAQCIARGRWKCGVQKITDREFELIQIIYELNDTSSLPRGYAKRMAKILGVTPRSVSHVGRTGSRRHDGA